MPCSVDESVLNPQETIVYVGSGHDVPMTENEEDCDVEIDEV